MIVDAVTARYAGALYGLARRKNALDPVSKDVEALAAEIGRTATRGLLFNPRVERETKRKQLAPLLAAAHPLTRNFVNLLLDKDRESVLKGLAAAWKRLSLEGAGPWKGASNRLARSIPPTCPAWPWPSRRSSAARSRSRTRSSPSSSAARASTPPTA